MENLVNSIEDQGFYTKIYYVDRSKEDLLSVEQLNPELKVLLDKNFSANPFFEPLDSSFFEAATKHKKNPHYEKIIFVVFDKHDKFIGFGVSYRDDFAMVMKTGVISKEYQNRGVGDSTAPRVINTLKNII